MIETSRLILRPYTLDDYEPYHAMTSDPAVYKFLAGEPLSREDIWNRLLRYAGHWDLLGFGMFAVIDKATGRYIGETGLADFRRGLGDQLDGHDEAAWAFNGSAQGKGMGSEAAQAAHDWHDAHRNQKRTVCIVHQDNVASVKLAEKLGYRAFGTCEYKNKSLVTFERIKPEISHSSA